MFVLHRNWIRTASDRFVLDPGIPEARDWITSIVAEVVQNYPIDGVQFDDYFYTETASSRLTTTRLSAVTGRAMPRRATGGGITPSSS